MVQMLTFYIYGPSILYAFCWTTIPYRVITTLLLCNLYKYWYKILFFIVVDRFRHLIQLFQLTNAWSETVSSLTLVPSVVPIIILIVLPCSAVLKQEHEWATPRMKGKSQLVLHVVKLKPLPIMAEVKLLFEFVST